MMIKNDIFQLAIYVFSGFLIGFVFHKWIMPVLAKLAAKTRLKSDDLIVSIINKWIISWFVALGLFIGLKNIEINDKYHTWLQDGLVVFYLFSLTWIAARIISGMVKIKASGTDAIIPSSSIIGNIIKIIIYCIGLLIILQSLGISITPILTALGVGGLAVALALQDTLSNLFAGLQIIASGKINPGDFVKLDSGEEGFIQDITWRSTTIRAVTDHIIIVPNSKISGMIVSNFYLPQHEVTFMVEVGVSYDSDLKFVEKVTLEVIRQTLNEVEGGVKTYEPSIRFFAFGDSSINLKALLRVTEYVYQYTVKHEFIKRLHERYVQEGINIPFPIRTIYIKKEDA
ncbi:MAG: mechanosensitive ion channel [Bacteroidota bacterium]|nr:mechanosensitive ion channel [Bacteroidota bacterium]